MYGSENRLWGGYDKLALGLVLAATFTAASVADCQDASGTEGTLHELQTVLDHVELGRESDFVCSNPSANRAAGVVVDDLVPLHCRCDNVFFVGNECSDGVRVHLLERHGAKGTTGELK